MATSARFHPLLPDERASGSLLARAAALVSESLRLESAAGGLSPALSPLLRGMNSYYSNKIEGQHTRPSDIQRALHKQFSISQAVARGGSRGRHLIAGALCWLLSAPYAPPVRKASPKGPAQP